MKQYIYTRENKEEFDKYNTNSAGGLYKTGENTL